MNLITNEEKNILNSVILCLRQKNELKCGNCIVSKSYNCKEKLGNKLINAYNDFIVKDLVDINDDVFNSAIICLCNENESACKHCIYYEEGRDICKNNLADDFKNGIVKEIETIQDGVKSKNIESIIYKAFMFCKLFCLYHSDNAVVIGSCSNCVISQKLHISEGGEFPCPLKNIKTHNDKMLLSIIKCIAENNKVKEAKCESCGFLFNYHGHNEDNFCPECGRKREIVDFDSLDIDDLS